MLTRSPIFCRVWLQNWTYLEHCCAAATWPLWPGWSGTGIPVDTAVYERLEASWSHIKGQLIAEVDRDYSVYDGASFKIRRFEAYLAAAGFPGPDFRAAPWILRTGPSSSRRAFTRS
jgi:hypothetical protein